ncbi:hypothetical protein [Mycolicibacterium peregrinum]|uniref:hypothetical protein n=1 Tax=Mycolicibacterium peregrinum TaxID=43304 RepID=UPI003AABCC3B
MPTFATPTPLTERITTALHSLRVLRAEGNPEHIAKATDVLDGYLDRLPRRENP